MCVRDSSGRTVRTKYQGTKKKGKFHAARAGGVQWGVVTSSTTFFIETQIKGTLVMSLLNGVCGKACARFPRLDRSAFYLRV